MDEEPKRVGFFKEGNQYGKVEKLPSDIRAALAFTRRQLKSAMVTLLNSGDYELTQMLQRGTNGQKIIASIVYNAQKGSKEHQKMIVDRLLGAVKTQDQLNNDDDNQRSDDPFDALTNDQLFALALAIKQKASQNKDTPTPTQEVLPKEELSDE
jgi:hypothetical protein